jgi:hypothetical protein
MAGKYTLELLDIPDESVYAVMGISEERSDEIVDICKDAYKKKNYFTDTLKEIVENMDSLEEIVFAVLCVGKVHASQREKNSENPAEMMKMLEMMMKLRSGK